MKDKILKKLGSEKGASITFALLLFLVCTVLSSVILSAATAASGRMARMAQTDQKYYSVTSAAELLKDIFKDKTVTVERVVTEEADKHYSGGAVTIQSTARTSDMTRILLDNVELDTITSTGLNESAGSYTANATRITTPGVNQGINSSFAAEAAFKMVETSPVTVEYMSLYPSQIAGNSSRNVIMKAMDSEPLAVLVTETINPQENGITDFGVVTFILRNAVKKEGESGYTEAPDKYQVKLTFAADISKNESVKATDQRPYEISDSGTEEYKFKTVTDTTTTTTLKWKLLRVE